MFNNEIGFVADLPTQIQPFYIDELRSEPTGEMVEEKYDYYDEEGNLQIGTRLVPEYHDVNYTVEKPRWDLKDWSYVEQAKNYEAKKHGIYKACEAEEWQYHDEFVEWYFRPEPKRAQDADPFTPENEAWENGFTPEMHQSQPEPVNTATDPEPVLIALHEEMAIPARRDHIYSVLVTDRGPLDMDAGKDGVYGIDNLNDTLVAVDLGLDASEGVNWIMADNTVELLMLEDIQCAVRDFNIRKQAVFTQYGNWRAGDRLSPFSINKGDV